MEEAREATVKIIIVLLIIRMADCDRQCVVLHFVPFLLAL